MKLGLALSGGGVRGAAHIGVLKALEEANIRPDFISGTSVGSIIAGLYSIGYSPDEMKEIFLQVSRNLIDYDLRGILNFVVGSVFRNAMRVDGFIRGDRIEYIFNHLAKDKGKTNIMSTKIPLAIPAVDINTSEIIMFCSKRIYDDRYVIVNDAKISEAVRASISYPMIFKPKMFRGRRLVDGGVRDNVPARILKKMGADKVLAVNLGYCGELDEGVDNILEIANQTIDIMAYSIFKYSSRDIDYLLKPRIYNVKMLEFDKIYECIERGYKYTKMKISELKRQLYI